MRKNTRAQRVRKYIMLKEGVKKKRDNCRVYAVLL